MRKEGEKDGEGAKRRKKTFAKPKTENRTTRQMDSSNPPLPRLSKKKKETAYNNNC